MPNHHVITGLGGLDGQYSWISGNIEEVLGLTTREVLEHRLAITPFFPGGETYAQIFIEEKGARSPRLSFRSWLIKAHNNGISVPVGVTALFLRDDDGELANVVGAAWPMEQCPVCSQMFPHALCRAALALTKAATTSL